MEKIKVKNITDALPSILHFPVKEFYIDYDKEADVLYISFERPQEATDTDILEEGILVRYKGEKVVGVTILNASKWEKKSNREKK